MKRALRRQQLRRMKQKAIALGWSIKDAEHLANGDYTRCQCYGCIKAIGQHVQERKAERFNANWQDDSLQLHDDYASYEKTYNR